MKRKFTGMFLVLVLIISILAGCGQEKQESAGGGKTKILLDTDIGNDVDDSLAITYLLSHEDVELMGITTCTGIPWMRAMLAEIICDFHDQEIPIYPGEERALNGPVLQYQINDYAKKLINTYEHSEYDTSNQAVEFMRQIIEENPHEITLACIGTMTNASLLFSEYPHVAGLLDGMIIMGGMYGECDQSKWGEIEWNIKGDPEAAAIVFQQDVEDCLVIGVEVSSQIYAPAIWLESEFSKKEECRPVADLLPAHEHGSWDVRFHDIIPLMAYLEEGEFETCQGNIEVVLESATGKPVGTTVFTADEDGRHTLITGCSADWFLQKYAETVGIDSNY